MVNKPQLNVIKIQLNKCMNKRLPRGFKVFSFTDQFRKIVVLHFSADYKNTLKAGWVFKC